jgi:chromosome segregation ATPase
VGKRKDLLENEAIQHLTFCVRKLEAELDEATIALGQATLELAAADGQLLMRDAAVAPLKASLEELRQENARLRREFKGFVESIEWWKSELADGVELEQGALDGSA